MDNVKDISDCFVWLSGKPKYTQNKQIIRSECAEFLEYQNGYPIFKATVPIRSYKITYNGMRKVITTVITPPDARFFVKGENMQSEKVLVEEQSYCHKTPFDRLWFDPDNTNSPWLGNYATGEYTYPDKFIGEHGIYSTHKTNHPVRNCF